MIEVEELGRRVYVEMTNDHGAESVCRELLGERADSLDEFDRLGYVVAFVSAWATLRIEEPGLAEAELAERAARAADMCFRAQNTIGGWEAMAAGEPSDRGQKLIEWIETLPETPEPGVTA